MLVGRSADRQVDGAVDDARQPHRQALLVWWVVVAGGGGAVSPLTDADRPVVAVEPHQQPATTQARWIGRPREALAPIVVRWSMDDSPR